MPVPSKPYTFSNTPPATNPIDATQVNADFDALYNALNPAVTGLDLTNLATALVNLLMPTGSVIATARSTVPSAEYLMCDGAAVSRTGATAALFAAIGTAYGVGDGTSTFNLPDLRGRVPVGEDVGGLRISSFQIRGQAAGEWSHILTTPEMPAHTHSKDNCSVAVGNGGSIVASGASGSNATGSTGGGGAHNNMQPYQVVNYMIKV